MNKTMLWVFLAISAVLFLYPSITTLLDILDAIGKLSSAFSLGLPFFEIELVVSFDLF